MSSMHIRIERSGDAGPISALVTHAFEGAEHSSGTEAAIIEALRRSGALAVSLVAEEDGAIVGHVAVSPATIAGEDPNWFGLGPVAVRPDRQRRGIGKSLVREALSGIKAQGAGGCVVLGDPDYYRRFGFRCDPRLVYPGVGSEYFQALHFAGPWPEGVVAYHPAFDVS